MGLLADGQETGRSSWGVAFERARSAYIQMCPYQGDGVTKKSSELF